MISSRYAQSKKKRKIIFSRKKIMRGGQIVPINTLQTHVYVNLNVTGSTVSVNNITNSLVKSIATNTPGSIILSVDPKLSTLADYTLFGYKSDTSAWVEIPRTNLDAGGNSVALYGNVPGMLIRKQADVSYQRASMEISIPVPASTYGNIMQFVNITDSVFEFTATNSPDTLTNVYVQLIFTDTYETTGTKLSGWLPTYIPSLSLWLNGSEPGTGTFTPNTGVKMTNWADKSGKNNHAAAASATAPLYRNLPGGVGMGMYFNGSTFFSGKMQAAGNYSYTFSVARPDIANPVSGRILSLGASGVDDSSSNSSIGVSASAGGVPTPTKPTIVMGLGAAATNKILYSTDGGTTWVAPAVSTWPAGGSCSSIAYNGYMYVAVGDNGSTRGFIQYSTDGKAWTAANPPAAYRTDPVSSSSYGFSYSTATPSPAWVGNGGIKVVIYTGTMFICGGRGINGSPAMAYSHDGINWILNTTTLPFTGAGDCIRTIATNGKMLILSGFLKPSMAYSYNGINWFAMPAAATTVTQIANAPDFSGVHAVAWSSAYNFWVAVGDGGNPTGTVTAADAYKKVAFSSDGFIWVEIDSSTGNQVPTSGPALNRTRVFITPVFGESDNQSTVYDTIICATPINYSGSSTQNFGPLFAAKWPISSSYPYGLIFYHSSNSLGTLFPLTGGKTNETSAVYWDGTKLFWGLQQTPWLITNKERAGGWNYIGPTTLINGPVNAIIDNSNPNRDFTGSSYLNGENTSASVKDTNTTLPYIVSAWTDGTNTCVAINGTTIPIYKVNPAQFNISSYMVGKNQGTTHDNYTGYIYEIVNYSGSIYAVARRVIEGYLSWKWAIQSLLPTTHPFYRNPPTKFSITTPWPLIFQDLKPLLWLDGQDPNGNESVSPPDRTLISTWVDKSGNRNNLKAPSGSEPMFRTNVVSGGGLQFNRYPYQSMSIIPVQFATATLPTTDMTFSGSQPFTLTPSAWIPGFGGFSGTAGAATILQGATYDTYGFAYIGWTISSKVQIIQYDENNVQTRMLYFFNRYRRLRSMCVGPISGCIYVALETAVAGNSPFMVITPNALPITASTTYKVTYPTLFFPAATQINTTGDGAGVGALAVDENENIYLGFYTAPLYAFPYTSFTYTSACVTGMTASLAFQQISPSSVCSLTYSSVDKSISYYPSGNGMISMYLNTVCVFIGSIVGTVLTVSSITSGAITLTSTLNTASAGTITAQTSGTTGGVGVYTVSVSQTVAGGTSIMSVYLTRQIGNGGTITGALSRDGLINAGNASDPVAVNVLDGSTKAINVIGGKVTVFDPIGNYSYTIMDVRGVGNPGGRLRRIHMPTRQVVTLAGSVNRSSFESTVALTSERFPPTYEPATNVSDTPFTGLTTEFPIIVGKQSIYLPINTTSGDITIKRYGKLTNPMATSSCMSGPITITGNTVSVFIVYINTNTNKAVMPHNAAYQSPIISLATRSDSNVFTGGIEGTVLTVSAVSSGKIELGAILNTPLGGFIASYGTATAANPVGTYNIGTSQYIPTGTRITCSNGIDAINNNITGTVGATVSGASDANSSSFISLYANNTGTAVYRNNGATTGYAASTSTAIAAASPVVWPVSALPTVFEGRISGTVLTVDNMISGCIQVGAVLDTPSGGKITSLGTANGLTLGTYNISVSQTITLKRKITATMPPILPELLFYSCSANTVRRRFNGGTTTTTAGSFTPLNVSAIGLGLQPSNVSRKDALLPNYFFDGIICEVLVYNTDLTTDNMRLSAMEGYLAWKWGIESKLQSSHVYKYVPPTDLVVQTPSTITSANFVYAYDSSFMIAWSGGNNATSYSYSLTQGGNAVTTAKFVDYGLISKRVFVHNLSGNTTYSLTITAYSTLKSIVITRPFITKRWVLTLLVGSTSTALDAGAAGGAGDGVGTAARLIYPFGLSCDRFNNIYFLDGGVNNGCVRVASISTGIVRTISTSVGNPMNNIPSTAVDNTTGIIYVNNTAGSIYRLTPSSFPLVVSGSTITTTWTSTLFISGSGATINSGIVSSTFQSPIAVDNAGNVYFVAVSGTTRTITKVDVGNNNTLTTIPQISSTIAENIANIRFDLNNNMWITTYTSHVVLMMTPAGNIITYGVSGTSGTTNGDAETARFNSPLSLAIDRNGAVYVHQEAGHYIRRIFNGSVETILGKPSSDNSVTYAITDYNLGTAGSVGTFSFNRGLTVDMDGNLYNGTFSGIVKFTLT